MDYPEEFIITMEHVLKIFRRNRSGFLREIDTLILFQICEYHLANAENMLDHLLESYDKRIRPNGTELPGYNGYTGPVKVNITLHILDIESLDIKKGTFTTKFYYRQKWIDERLKFERRSGMDVVQADASKVWVPDIFFDAMDAKLHNVPITNSFLRIKHTGEVLYSQCLSMTIGCPMDLTFYPFDMHLCNIRLESFQYTADDLELTWGEGRPVAMEPAASLYDMSFALEEKPSTVNISMSTGIYQALIAGINAGRFSTTTVLSAYIPSTFLVIVAGLCLCLEALHKWLITCTVFIVLALVETILVSPAVMWNTSQTDKVGSCPKRTELLRNIDLGFQILYAASFILFLIIYWSLMSVIRKGNDEYWNSLQV